MRTFLIALLFLFGSLAIQPQDRAVLNHAHKSAYHTSEKTVLDRALCSATAIGPHALLTASHCEMATDSIQLGSIDLTLHIDAILRDGNDHTIYLISGTTFPVYSTISENRKLDQGETVFLFGNPGNWSDIFRRGYYVGNIDDVFISQSLPTQIAFDLKVYHGDSGAAIFDASGQIVGVVTGTEIQRHGGSATDTITLSFSFPLAFTPKQIERARTYAPATRHHAVRRQDVRSVKVVSKKKGK